MAKLINVIKDGDGELEKRQLPLVIDEKLTMVLDLIDVDFMCEYPKIRGKDKELFLRKFSMLSTQELKEAFQVSCKRLLDIVSEIVPCVGCRRSVERLFHQMKTGPGRSGLYPLVVTPEGVLILPEEVYKWPNVIGAMFHNHTAKLNNLSTSWSRSKKSSRCALHSLDAQRCVRPPLGSGWRALWECMVPFCKQEVATIDTSQLLSTLETYLLKHRFCTECRTKVMKAYSLLVDEPEERKSENNETSVSSTPCDKAGHSHGTENTEPGKEKGFIPSLYAGIRRCSPNNHIHVDQRTDYIMGLILAAEPELLGNRRERHAKTLEIAQEEVLVCVGLCLYERVHRIQLRLREEQTTCQLLALVAINALSTNFQLAVETKQGISQLELLFQEFSREDRLKQKRKQVKKLKKRRKKQRKNAAAAMNALQEINQFSNDEDEKQNSDEEEIVKEEDDDEDDDDNECSAKEEKSNDSDEEKSCNIKSYYQINNERIMKIVRSDAPPKYSEKKDDSCFCSKYEGTSNSKNKKENHRVKSPNNVDLRSRYSDKGKKSSTNYETTRECTTTVGKNGKRQQENKDPKSRIVNRPINEFSDTNSNSSGSSSSIYSKYHSDKDNASNNFISFNKSSSNTSDISNTASDTVAACDCCSSIQMDCGYGSADNNNISSSNGSGESSVDSSEVACSEGFCNHEGTEECNFELRDGGGGDHGGVPKKGAGNYDHNKNSILILDSASQSLQQMLTETSADRELHNDHRIGDCIIPVEEIQRYKSSMSRINEKRKQLRQTLKSEFALLCLKQQCDVLPML